MVAAAVGLSTSARAMAPWSSPSCPTYTTERPSDVCSAVQPWMRGPSRRLMRSAMVALPTHIRSPSMMAHAPSPG